MVARQGPKARAALSVLAAASLLCGIAAREVGAEPVQQGGLRVALSAKLSPRALPRRGRAPISVRIGARFSSVEGTPPPLRSFQIAINREGRLQREGLPICRLEDIQPATTANALRACGPALVGEGTFSASVAIPEQSPFPSQGKILAFNGTQHGRPVIFAHVYGTEPLPTSFTLPLRIASAKGTFGTVLSASLPNVTANIAYVTGIELDLGRVYSHGGTRQGYLSAGCPAPAGFPGAVFSLLRAGFTFADGRTLATTLQRSCHATG